MKSVALLLLLGCAAAVSAADVPAAPCRYIVQGGDSAFGIGKKYGLSLEEVTKANPDVADVTLIRPGDILALPCAGNITTAATLLDLIAGREELATLFAAVVAAGPELLKDLNDTAFKGTLFAPTDDAFDQALGDLGLNATDLLADKLLLGDVLAYHVVPGFTAPLDQYENKDNLTSLLGDALIVNKKSGVIRLKTTSGQKVRVDEEAGDLQGGAAMLHLIKGVLLPESAVSAGAKPRDECTHVVVSGDSLFNIAQKYGTTVDILKKLNPQVKDDFLPLGTTLTLFESCV